MGKEAGLDVIGRIREFDADLIRLARVVHRGAHVDNFAIIVRAERVNRDFDIHARLEDGRIIFG